MPRESEIEFQGWVVDCLRLFGWRHLHVRRSIGKGKKWVTATNIIGWPDLFCWRERDQRQLAAELKSETGEATPEQAEILASLARAGIETYLWRPSDRDLIEKVLK